MLSHNDLVGVQMKPSLLLFFVILALLASCKNQVPQTKDFYSNLEKQNRSYILHAEDGRKMRITPYGKNIVRIQRTKAGETFYRDNHYEMVERHQWQGELAVLVMDDGKLQFTTSAVKLLVDPKSFTTSYYQFDKPVLHEKTQLAHAINSTMLEFSYDPDEHFSGLGHGYYGRAQSIDLKGQIIERNYGKVPIEQAPLIVPFYLSSKGYGVFINSMFSNRFNFGEDKRYQISLDDSGFDAQMDLFFIAGPKLPQVLDNYTQLTGRPRLPAKSMFGLQLSDKGHDHNSPTPSDENWWKTKITEHRLAGYPLDHVVNDNRWRAAGGKRCESKIEWDESRYPDPAEYGRWLKQNGIVTTLDFNRCIGQFSEGWKVDFNLPETGNIEFKESAPDLTNPDFQDWFWRVFYEKSLDPNLAYPGDALWIDEFDEQGAAPKTMLLANGRSSAEMRNYWFFLIAQSLVGDGWDKSDISKRPFVWVRGMTAGAQRWATLWSGDIYPNYADMAGQVRAMQLAGLSGFPFWGHDAGGFYDWDEGKGPDEAMYQQWAMAFGSFAPIWKPHGMGQSRWPLDRSSGSQKVASKFSRLRYELMPYLYTSAHQASTTGLPIARPMMLDHQEQDLAWQYDLQYMWGESILVAPLTAESGSKEIWLPEGQWFEYTSDKPLAGGQVLPRTVKTGDLPVYVKAGAIIPKRHYAQSTTFIDKSHLNIDLYLGADGQFTLYEDDDVTELYRTAEQVRKTRMVYDANKATFSIETAQGAYAEAGEKRSYSIQIFGAKSTIKATLHGQPIELQWSNSVPSLTTEKLSVTETLQLSFANP
jgi:alpha-glucosidase (family GH31 glycosyl hydrolase)